MFSYLCIHTPRKEWRSRLPTKVAVVVANNRNEALKQFIPFHPKDPDAPHYNKPYAAQATSPHYIR